jgi:hypothetical protein
MTNQTDDTRARVRAKIAIKTETETRIAIKIDIIIAPLVQKKEMIKSIIGHQRVRIRATIAHPVEGIRIGIKIKIKIGNMDIIGLLVEEIRMTVVMDTIAHLVVKIKIEIEIKIETIIIIALPHGDQKIMIMIKIEIDIEGIVTINGKMT